MFASKSLLISSPQLGTLHSSFSPLPSPPLPPLSIHSTRRQYTPSPDFWILDLSGMGLTSSFSHEDLYISPSRSPSTDEADDPDSLGQEDTGGGRARGPGGRRPLRSTATPGRFSSEIMLRRGILRHIPFILPFTLRANLLRSGTLASREEGNVSSYMLHPLTIRRGHAFEDGFKVRQGKCVQKISC